MIVKLVYLMCSATSLLCAVLLLRGYVRSRAGLLFWSTLCFWFITAANVLLFMDTYVVMHVSLATYRSVTTLLAATIMLVGLIWETV